MWNAFRKKEYKKMQKKVKARWKELGCKEGKKKMYCATKNKNAVERLLHGMYCIRHMSGSFIVKHFA